MKADTGGLSSTWCVQLKIRTLVISFYTLSIALLWFVKMNACRSYCYTWCSAARTCLECV